MLEPESGRHILDGVATNAPSSFTWTEFPQALTPTPGPHRFEPRMRALGLTQSGDIRKKLLERPTPDEPGYAAPEYQNVTVALNRTSRGAVIAVVFRSSNPRDTRTSRRTPWACSN